MTITCNHGTGFNPSETKSFNREIKTSFKEKQSREKIKTPFNNHRTEFIQKPPNSQKCKQRKNTSEARFRKWRKHTKSKRLIRKNEPITQNFPPFSAKSPNEISNRYPFHEIKRTS